MNINGSFELRILHMKMRRRMVIEIHSDDEAVKEADGWHEE
jgi:hypothetical protein